MTSTTPLKFGILTSGLPPAIRPLGSQLTRNTIAGGVCALAAMGLLGITYPVYLHYLGFSQYGLWLVLSTVLTFAQLGNLGMAQAVSKQVAAEIGKGDHAGVISCVTTALCSLLVSSGVLLIGLIYFRFGIARQFHLPSEEAKQVSGLLPLIGLLSLYAIFLETLNSTLAGSGRLDLYSYLQLMNQLISTGVTIVGLMLGKGIGSFLFGSAIGYLVMHVGTHVSIRRLYGLNAFQPKHFSVARLRETLSLSLYLMGSTAVSMLLTPLNRILLARYVGLSSVPAYHIIFSGCMKTRSLLDTVVRPLMPEVSRLNSGFSGDVRREIKELNRKMMRVVLLTSGSLYLALFVFGAPLLRLWLGERLAAGVPVIGLRFCVAGMFFSAVGLSSFYTLLGLGYGRSLFVANILQAAIPVFTILAATLLGRPISLALVFAGVALGMAIANCYLIWMKTWTVNSMFGTAC